MPVLMAYTTVLSGSAHNNRAFQWTPLLDKCFESIKTLASRTLIPKLVDFSTNELVWVVTDGSKTGVSAVYRQGKDWEHCHPAGSLLKKFTNVQHKYCTHEHETTKVLNTSRLNWYCLQDKHGGGNTFPVSTITPFISMMIEID